MRMIKVLLLTLTIVSINANAVSLNFKQGDELVSASSVIKLDLEVSHKNTVPMSIEIQSRSGNKLNPSVIQFPQGHEKLVGVNQIEDIPVYLKMRQPGIYNVTLCAAEEPIEYFNKDGVRVNLIIRICDTIKITRR